MHSLDRLIALVAKTGDRLIIHDPVGEDIVLMSIDQYEQLVLGRRDLTSLTSEQLTDQINRDISVWRTHQEERERIQRDFWLEDELWEKENEFFNPPDDDGWESTKKVLAERYGFGGSNEEDGCEELDDDRAYTRASAYAKATADKTAGEGEIDFGDLDEEDEDEIDFAKMDEMNLEEEVGVGKGESGMGKVAEEEMAEPVRVEIMNELNESPQEIPAQVQTIDSHLPVEPMAGEEVFYEEPV